MTTSTVQAALSDKVPKLVLMATAHRAAEMLEMPIVSAMAMIHQQYIVMRGAPDIVAGEMSGDVLLHLVNQIAT
jgi:hypothetical protein